MSYKPRLFTAAEGGNTAQIFVTEDGLKYATPLGCNEIACQDFANYYDAEKRDWVCSAHWIRRKSP